MFKIFYHWLKKTCIRTYKFKPLGGTILFMDRATFHTREEVIS